MHSDAVQQRSRRCLIAAALLWAAVVPANAAPVSCFNPTTVQDLILLGSEGCVAGSRRFFDFSYSTVAAGGAIPIPASDVAVEFPGTRFGQPVLFTGDWTVDASASLDVLISYRFAGISARAAGVDIIAEVRPPDERARLHGTVCMALSSPCDSELFHLSPGEPTAIPPLGSEGTIELSLALIGSGVPGDPILINGIISTLAVPEPSVLLLVVAAGWARAFAARRRGAARRTPPRPRRRLDA